MSKGSSPRPFSVDLKTFDSNFDAIFRKPDPRAVEDQVIEDEAFNSVVNAYNNERLVSNMDKEQLASEIKDSTQGG